VPSLKPSLVSYISCGNKRDPLTRLASADENASSIHPLPQGGEGCNINSPLALSGARGQGVRGRAIYLRQILRGRTHRFPVSLYRIVI